MDPYRIFDISTEADFESLALDTYRFQYQQVPLYRSYSNHLKRNPSNVRNIDSIPFLPIEFFKKNKILNRDKEAVITFTSSGTTGSSVSEHFVADTELYGASFTKCFEQFYGADQDYCILALLPSYLERNGSSLIYMINEFIARSPFPESGFYLDDLESLSIELQKLDKKGVKILLFGVSFALLDLAELVQLKLQHTTIMETGGMKGRKKEMVREELHGKLKRSFGVDAIHSEYGMTELLSQAYSKADGIFHCPPWMRVRIREAEDPLAHMPIGRTGGINIVDLANFHSCSFLATQDLGKLYRDGGFEVLGRFDHSDIRGCNLLLL